jgi:hypothetical protein
MTDWLTIEGEVTQNEFLGRIRSSGCSSIRWWSDVAVKH